jgi:hypothetical protein
VQALRQSLQSQPNLLASGEISLQTREQLRQQMHVGWLRQIQAGLQRTEKRENPPWWRMIAVSVILGYVFGQLFGEWIYGTNHSYAHDFPFFFFQNQVDVVALSAALAMGFLLVLCFLGAQWRLWQWQRDREREALRRSIHDFHADFPELVRSWGGVSVLHTSEAVHELLREV